MRQAQGGSSGGGGGSQGEGVQAHDALRVICRRRTTA